LAALSSSNGKSSEVAMFSISRGEDLLEKVENAEIIVLCVIIDIGYDTVFGRKKASLSLIKPSFPGLFVGSINHRMTFTDIRLLPVH